MAAKKKKSTTPSKKRNRSGIQSVQEEQLVKSGRKAPNVADRFYLLDSMKYGTTTPWWSESVEAEDKWKYLYDAVCSMKSSQGGRYQMFRRYASIYEYGFKASTTFTAQWKMSDDSTLMAGNRAFSVIRTIIADAFSQEVTPQIYTEGGTISERQLADDATHAVQSVLDECNYRQLEEDIFVDALSMSGTGFLKIYPDFANGCVKIERIIPNDVLLDDAECRNGDPRTLSIRYLADKAVLQGYFDCEGMDADAWKPSFGEMEKSIDATATANWGDDAGEHNLGDGSRVEVQESIHLPSRYVEQPEEGQEASADGAHLVAVNGATLYCGKWTKKKFNVVWATPLRSRTGFWGIPMMRFLAPIQRELEVWDMRVQRAMRRNGGTNLLIPKNAKINLRHLTNDSGTLVEYEGGNPPQELTPTPLHPQVLQYGDMLESRMMRWSGQSNMAATGEIPAGLTHVSGKALTTVLDTGSRVNAYVLRERERLIVEVTDRVLEAVAELVEYNADFCARYLKGPGYKTIKWADIVESRERLMLKCKPINAISTHPTAKLAQLTELLQLQAITPQEWRRRSQVMDVESNEMLDLAPSDIIEQLLDTMVEQRKFIPPRPYFNLDLCLEMGTKYYCMLMVQRPDDEEVLEYIDQWCVTTKQYMNEANPPAPAMPMGMPGMPGMGGPPGMPGMGGPPPGMGGPPQMPGAAPPMM